MRKINLTRVIFLLVIFSFVLSVLAGCHKPHDDISNNEKKQQLLNELAYIANNENNNGIEIKKIEAELYFQNAALSAAFPLYIVVDDENLYINDKLYSEIVYTETVEITYSTSFVEFASSKGNEILETLNKIKDHHGFYILDTGNGNHYEKIAICIVDNNYYFISFSEKGDVQRIHSCNLNIGR